LGEIQSRLLEIELGEANQVVWNLKSDNFSSAETWEKLKDKQPIVDWHKVLWFLAAIPKHSFVSLS
jgi:hypothetical protein